MRTSIFTFAGLFALAVASPGYQKRTDDEPSTNSTSAVTTSLSRTSASVGTGIETAAPSTTGIFSNGTYTTSETTSTASTTMAHKTTLTSSMPSSSTSAAGAAPTGVWAHLDAKSAIAGAVGVLGFALAL
ncbi:hypothetical protein K3495_g13100 [Podosphaera aphanis]|nr:hypothetical protein K3495_g13100 [Podosphaera aphanis]